MEPFLIAYAGGGAALIFLIVRQYIMKPYEAKIKLLKSKVQLYQTANKIELS